MNKLDLDRLRSDPRALAVALAKATLAFNADRSDSDRSARLMLLIGMAVSVLAGHPNKVVE